MPTDLCTSDDLSGLSAKRPGAVKNEFVAWGLVTSNPRMDCAELATPPVSRLCRLSKLGLLDKRMQRLDRGLPLLHRDEQAHRIRRHHVLVGDNPVMCENL